MAVKRNFDSILTIVLVLAIFGGVVVSLRAGMHPQVKNKENTQVGKQLPEASFFNAMGQKIELADFKGQVVLVNLWATWCPPCVVELPALDKLQAKLKDRNFKIVAIV